MDLEGRVAVVTGAASGIGRATARRFAADGMAVVLADIERPVLEQATNELRETGADVRSFAVDVADPEQVSALREFTVAEFGTAHVLFNNAGVGGTGKPTWRTPVGVWEWVVGVDLLGVAWGIREFVPLFVEQGEGHVINTASEAGICATPMLGAYHAAKYGVVGLSEALVMELAGTGVGVSCLCPELVDTRIFESTRNAPASLDLPPPVSVPLDAMATMMHTTAMDPALVADMVRDAVVDGSFWILTHDSTQRRVEHRDRALEQRRTPEMLPFGGDW
jgi:NAD(P)-dependent dehydrogenase (short-subunit alcohol dehydrogenase family)